MRPDILFPLFRDLTTLNGIGDKIAQNFEGLTGRRIKDLLFSAPRRYVDRSFQDSIIALPDGETATFEARITQHIPSRAKGRPYRVMLDHNGLDVALVFFHARADWLTRSLPEGSNRIFSGKIERYRGQLQLTHPDYMVKPENLDSIPLLEPVYDLTSGVSLKVFIKAVKQALSLTPPLVEWVNDDQVIKNGWPSFRDALQTLHRPENISATGIMSPARQRLAYDELLARQLALQLSRRASRASDDSNIEDTTSLAQQTIEAAPFTPTGAQIRCYSQIKADLEASTRMSRLLQGDVGAGKTFVAALAAAHVAGGAGQTAIMAPTEILARQHEVTLTELLGPLGVKVTALTGKDKGKAREYIKAEMENGEAQIICGTHALFQQGISFNNLSLVVIDEQHRFGVHDRLKLTSKGSSPNLLVMSATPIPRTLALANYGDLDISRLDEKPAGRIPITTVGMPLTRAPEIMQGLERALSKGEKVYWVCPLVEDSELIDLTSAEDRFESLKAIYGDRVGLLHGRMKSTEKTEMARQFKLGNLDVLVATTVIEVGVDSPDATVIVIEHAERFGLAQLHQLRGRVGRSDKASSCVLLYKPPLGKTAHRRLDILKTTEDGFLIAEEDWKLRGSGDLLGTRQSGTPDLRLADLDYHAKLLEYANKDAALMIERGNDSDRKRSEALRTLLYLFDHDTSIHLMQNG